MVQIIKSDQRHSADHGWLQTHWHFSFGDYHDPANIHWGALRVFNDDIVQPQTGFDTHPHRDMEIVTYVIDGTLTHSDNLGNEETLQAGEVQVMSAGKGILHGERNAHSDKPVHLLQLWILPRSKNNAPRWEQRPFAIADRAGELVPVVSGGDIPDTLTIDQDAAIRVGRLRAGDKIVHANAGKRAYAFVISGDIELNGQRLGAGDQARLADEKTIQIEAGSDAHLMLLDLP